MAKKAAPKAAAPPKPPTPAAKGAPKPATKSEILAALAEKTGLGKTQINNVFDALAGV
jgi:hypothetical protein